MARLTLFLYRYRMTTRLLKPEMRSFGQVVMRAPPDLHGTGSSPPVWAKLVTNPLANSSPQFILGPVIGKVWENGVRVLVEMDHW